MLNLMVYFFQGMAVLFKPIIALHIINFYIKFSKLWGGGGGGRARRYVPTPNICKGGDCPTPLPPWSTPLQLSDYKITLYRFRSWIIYILGVKKKLLLFFVFNNFLPDARMTEIVYNFVNMIWWLNSLSFFCYYNFFSERNNNKKSDFGSKNSFRALVGTIRPFMITVIKGMIRTTKWG